MEPYIILGVLLGLPLLLGILFRVNTSHLFFSLLAGDLLARYFADDAELVLRMFVRNGDVAAYGKLSLLVLPMVLTAIFLRRSLKRGMILFHLIPLALTGFVFAAFASHLLPFTLMDQIKSIDYGKRLLEGSDTIIGAVVALQLVMLWLLNRPGEHGKKHK
jgi:hypothetical protein